MPRDATEISELSRFRDFSDVELRHALPALPLVGEHARAFSMRYRFPLVGSLLEHDARAVRGKRA